MLKKFYVKIFLDQKLLSKRSFKVFWIWPKTHNVEKFHTYEKIMMRQYWRNNVLKFLKQQGSIEFSASNYRIKKAYFSRSRRSNPNRSISNFCLEKVRSESHGSNESVNLKLKIYFYAKCGWLENYCGYFFIKKKTQIEEKKTSGSIFFCFGIWEKK